MQINLTESEINQLLDQFASRNPKIKFTDLDTFDLSIEIGLGIRKNVAITIDHFTESSITLGYDMNTILHLALKCFAKLEIPEVIWDQKNQKFHIDPMAFLKKKLSHIPINFLIRNLSIESGMLRMDLETVI